MTLLEMIDGACFFGSIQRMCLTVAVPNLSSSSAAFGLLLLLWTAAAPCVCGSRRVYFADIALLRTDSSNRRDIGGGTRLALGRQRSSYILHRQNPM